MVYINIIMDLKKELLSNIDKIHTTELGVKRIRRNLSLETHDVVEYCTDILKNEDYDIDKKGKNFYVKYEDITFTINASSFTIITAHRK